MTKQRDLKQHVRERQAQTGESYMTALRHVLAARQTSPIPVIESVELTEIAALIGIKCRVIGIPPLVELVDTAAMLRQLHATLLAVPSDPALEVMRAVVLRGEEILPVARATGYDYEFLTRVHAGIGGINDNGRMLAVAVPGRHAVEMVVFLAWTLPAPFARRPPQLIITTVNGLQLQFHGPGALR